jgi:hypothetical protein
VIALTEATATTYFDSNVEMGATYVYRVWARTANGDGPLSAPVTQVVAAQVETDSLQTQITALQAQLETLQQSLATNTAKIAANTDSIAANSADIPALPTCLQTVAVEGQDSDDVVFRGCNVHIQNGGGSTDTTDGTGNLIIGYNEPGTIVGDRFLAIDATATSPARDGSHNLVIGPGHDFSSHSGFVAGAGNTISGAYASVSGGANNIASGVASSVSGGLDNLARGRFANAVGGHENTARGFGSIVVGGGKNTASGSASVVIGGYRNTASDDGVVVIGE